MTLNTLRTWFYQWQMEFNITNCFTMNIHEWKGIRKQIYTMGRRTVPSIGNVKASQIYEKLVKCPEKIFEKIKEHIRKTLTRCDYPDWAINMITNPKPCPEKYTNKDRGTDEKKRLVGILYTR